MVGALPRRMDEADQLAALDAFERDVLAHTTREAMAAKLRTIERALALWGLVPLPPSTRTLRALGATLKQGRYRSAASYLYIYKADAERQGFPWDPVLQRLLKDAIRSCERGMGPATRARPLPLLQLGGLPGGLQAWVAGGPARPRNAVVVGAWWLMREVELSTARAIHAEVIGDWWSSSAQLKLTLPMSKTDPLALGAARSHKCRCRD